MVVEISAGHPWSCERVLGHAGDHGPSSEYVRVTFAEKPARTTLDALKAAGFTWGGGSWVGARAKLPAEIAPPPAAQPVAQPEAHSGN